jgi:hypothetical protein
MKRRKYLNIAVVTVVFWGISLLMNPRPPANPVTLRAYRRTMPRHH